MGEPHNFRVRIFQRPGSRLFEISQAAWAAMQSFRQHDPPALEAGGVLLGRHLLDASAIIVDEVTLPMHGDRRTRASFYRDRKRHQEIIDRFWEASNGTCTYLGEWHTHPEPTPTPSAIDRRGWLKRLADDQFSEPLFFVIVGTQRTCVWEGTRDGVVMPLRNSAMSDLDEKPTDYT